MGQIFIKNKKQSKPTVVAAEYNFLNDGGAIGTINLGLFIPAFAIINRFTVKTIVAPLGAGASISYGFLGQLQFLMVINGVAAFVINQCLTGVDFNANPAMISTTRGAAPQSLMSITGGVLTAGRLVCSIEYTEFDF